MPGEPHHKSRPIRLPSPLTQAVLVAIGAVALVLFVLQLTAPHARDFGAGVSIPISSVATNRR